MKSKRKVKPIKVDEFFAILHKHVEISSRLVGTYNIGDANRWYTHVEGVSIEEVDDGQKCWKYITGEGSTAIASLEDFVKIISDKKITIFGPNSDNKIEVDVPKLVI